MSEVPNVKCDICGVESSATDPDSLPRCGTETCHRMILLPPLAPGNRYVRHLCGNNVNCFYAASEDEKTISCDRCKLSYYVSGEYEVAGKLCHDECEKATARECCETIGECRSGQTVYCAWLSIPWETQLKSVEEQKEAVQKENEDLKKELETEKEVTMNAKKEIAEKLKLIKELEQKVEELKEENKCLRISSGKLTDSVLNLSSAVNKTCKKRKTATHSAEDGQSEQNQQNFEPTKAKRAKPVADYLSDALKMVERQMKEMQKNGLMRASNAEVHPIRSNDQETTLTAGFDPAILNAASEKLRNETMNNLIFGSQAQTSMLNQMTDMMQKTTQAKASNAETSQSANENDDKAAAPHMTMLQSMTEQLKAVMAEKNLEEIRPIDFFPVNEKEKIVKSFHEMLDRYGNMSKVLNNIKDLRPKFTVKEPAVPAALVMKRPENEKTTDQKGKFQQE